MRWGYEGGWRNTLSEARGGGKECMRNGGRGDLEGSNG